MEPVIYTIIGIIVIAVIVVIVVHKRKSLEHSDGVTVETVKAELTVPSNKNLVQESQSEVTVRFEDLTALTESEEAALVEIKDQKLLARIDNAVPGTLQAVANKDSSYEHRNQIEILG